MSTIRIEAGDTGTAARPLYARLGGLSWLHFLNDGAANYLPGVLPAVLINLHLRPSLAGTVMAALLIGQAFQALTGWFADHIGGRLFIIAGVLGSSIAGALIGFSDTLWMLIPVLIVIGLTNALFHPQALAGARTLSRGRVGLGMSLFLVGGEVGRGLWPLFASLVVSAWGLHYLWLLALPALLSVALLWPSLPVQPKRHPDAAPIAWRRHLGPATALVAFSSLRALMIFGVVTYLPVLWHQRGHSLVESSALITVLLVVGVVGNVAGGHLSDVFGRKRVIFVAIVLSTIFMALFMSLGGGALQWLLLGLLGISLFATLPISMLIGQDIFRENRSLGSGIALGLSNGLGAAALILLDVVATDFGLVTVLWALVGVGMAASLISLVLPRHHH